MRSARWERTQQLTRGVWLAGIGLMLVRNRIFPDLLFVFGIVRLIESSRHPERLRSWRAGIVLIAIGLLVSHRLALTEIVLLAVFGCLLARFLAPASDRKPAVDMRLE
jgi:hypothetical protein